MMTRSSQYPALAVDLAHHVVWSEYVADSHPAYSPRQLQCG